jgi:hypothetical protein
MIEVSDAQVAPISPISRRRPTSVGLVAVAPAVVVLVAMIELPSTGATANSIFTQLQTKNNAPA